MAETTPNQIFEDFDEEPISPILTKTKEEIEEKISRIDEDFEARESTHILAIPELSKDPRVKHLTFGKNRDSEENPRKSITSFNQPLAETKVKRKNFPDLKLSEPLSFDENQQEEDEDEDRDKFDGEHEMIPFPKRSEERSTTRTEAKSQVSLYQRSKVSRRTAKLLSSPKNKLKMGSLKVNTIGMDEIKEGGLESDEERSQISISRSSVMKLRKLQDLRNRSEDPLSIKNKLIELRGINQDSSDFIQRIDENQKDSKLNIFSPQINQQKNQSIIIPYIRGAKQTTKQAQ